MMKEARDLFYEFLCALKFTHTSIFLFPFTLKFELICTALCHGQREETGLLLVQFVVVVSLSSSLARDHKLWIINYPAKCTFAI
jgi:hypothetical protein